MANFNTHFNVAAIGSGMLATLCLQVGFVDAQDALVLASAGVIGGILPDIDLHYSYPSRILFSLLGIILSFLWVFSAKNHTITGTYPKCRGRYPKGRNLSWQG